jgi:hypothetical protein
MERFGAIQVAFIPARFAEVERKIRVKQDDGSWQDDWFVKAVYGSLPSETVAKNERNWKSHRRGTDV